MYRSREITKKVYNNIMNSIQIWYKINTIFMNSKSVLKKTSALYRLILNLSDKIDLNRSDKYLIIAFTMHGKI